LTRNPDIYGLKNEEEVLSKRISEPFPHLQVHILERSKKWAAEPLELEEDDYNEFLNCIKTEEADDFRNRVPRLFAILQMKENIWKESSCSAGIFLG
jgi:hypothetical protein